MRWDGELRGRGGPGQDGDIEGRLGQESLEYGGTDRTGGLELLVKTHFWVERGNLTPAMIIFLINAALLIFEVGRDATRVAMSLRIWV